MHPNRIASVLKTVADQMDTLTSPERLATRDAIITAVYGEGDAHTDEFARIWAQDGPEAATAWDTDVNQLFSTVMATLFPGSEPFRAVSGDELRAHADRLTTT